LGGICGAKPLGSRRGRVRINEPCVGGICGAKPLGICRGRVCIDEPWIGGRKFIYNLYKYLIYICQCIYNFIILVFLNIIITFV
jgi:hypothetical protein